MKVLCIGHSAYDFTLPLEGYPVENQKYELHSIQECGGGPAANAAFLLGVWGMPASYAGKLGTDVYGEKIRRELEAAGVDLEPSDLDPDFKTSSSFILINGENGSRTLINYKPPKNPPLAWKRGLDKGWSTLLMDGHELAASLEAMECLPSAATILDAGSVREGTMRLGAVVDYLVCSEVFACTLAKMPVGGDPWDMVPALEAAEALNPNQVVVTLGERGCLYRLEGTVRHMPAVPVAAADTTGAGDIFHGAFAFGIARNLGLAASLAIATCAAGMSVEKLGGRSSIPSLEELRKRFPHVVPAL
ncbi:carbohydrate kinase family protein [Anaerotalea alkaliphila]|uniref:Carbohydrate kinase family protein n=1 Tax=Anaerotalea alkaliphila TaxID=2662126 RepID=A0A7X5HW64_9FIRM|nr:PfkB family carbohydrate kinase [Anaerotalea alkaliphila]NDL67764.1 carbohydrate kinase family protein [Anaerotalea alkaliphila]